MMAASRRNLSAFLSRDDALPHGEIFELLSNERRRGIIHHLKRSGHDAVPVDDLVDAVVAWETGTSGSYAKKARASVYSSLVQTHLPRLERAEVIEYDERTGLVEPTERMRQVELYLEYSPQYDIPWAEYYLGLSAVSAALLAVVWANLPPFHLVSANAVAGLIVTVLFVSSAVHVVQTRRSRLGSETLERV